MKTGQVQQTLKGRCQQAFAYAKKKAYNIKRAYHGEVYLRWCSNHPLKIVLIERPLGTEELPPTAYEPPPYSIVNKAEVLRGFEPQEIARCLDDSAQTFHEISQAVSLDAPKSSITEKSEGMAYWEMATRLYETVRQLREMRAELRELA
jgi:hypothetical protein